MPLGRCPQCGEGQIVGEEDCYRCNGPECGFAIPRAKHGRDIVPDEVKGLLARGISSALLKFVSKDGRQYRARLVLKRRPTGSVSLGLICVCPQCERGEVKKAEDAYRCDHPGCGFAIPRKKSGREITEEEEEALLVHGATPFLPGWVSRGNREFWARLLLKHWPNGSVSMEMNFDVGPCEKCENGRVHVLPNGYRCKNAALNPPQCDFEVYCDNFDPNEWSQDMKSDSSPKIDKTQATFVRCPMCIECLFRTPEGYVCEECGFSLFLLKAEQFLGGQFDEMEMEVLLGEIDSIDPNFFLDIEAADGSRVGARIESSKENMIMVLSFDI